MSRFATHLFLSTMLVACVPDKNTVGDSGSVGDDGAIHPDSHLLDSATPEAGRPDSATPEAGRPDSATPDAGLADSATPDTSTPDTSNPQPTLTSIISSSCSANESVKHLYYEKMIDAQNNYFQDTRALVSIPGTTSGKPYWDIRYVNPITKTMDGGDYLSYPNHAEFTGLDVRTGVDNLGFGTAASTGDSSGSIAQAECVGGDLTGGTTINLFDAPEQVLLYSGPQTTFAYLLGSAPKTSPWNADGTGNLMIQAHFDTPLYADFGGNYGGGVNFGFFVKNTVLQKHINFVISAYAIGDNFSAGTLKESDELLFDPTTQIVHVSTIIKDGTRYATKSLHSRTTEVVHSDHNTRTSDDGKWESFFRVNISYQNLLNVLQKANAQGWAFDLHPEDWELTSVMIQYELEEEGGGKARLSGSFRGFEVYSSATTQ